MQLEEDFEEKDIGKILNYLLDGRHVLCDNRDYFMKEIEFEGLVQMKIFYHYKSGIYHMPRMTLIEYVETFSKAKVIIKGIE